MKKSLRMAVVVCASFVGLAVASPALAAYLPKLLIEQTSYRLGAPTTVDTFIFADKSYDPTAKLTIYAPAGYSANISQAPGTKIGHVVAFVIAKALAGAPLTLSGDVKVANSADPTLVAASQRCTGQPTNQATWILDATLQGQAIQIPVFVNKPASGPALTEVVCLPSPDIPQSAGGAAFGAQLVTADFTVSGVFSNASVRKTQGYEWSSIFTPYVPGSATVNVAGTNEWRTYVGLPQTLTFKRVPSKSSVVSFAGRLTVTGVNTKGIRLHLYAGKKGSPAPNATSAGTGKYTARTKGLPASGKYKLTRPKVKVPTFFQMRFEDYRTDCNAPSPTGLTVPCNGEYLAPMTSGQVRATPPRKKKSAPPKKRRHP